jgi:hypothetical protein
MRRSGSVNAFQATGRSLPRPRAGTHRTAGARPACAMSRADRRNRRPTRRTTSQPALGSRRFPEADCPIWWRGCPDADSVVAARQDRPQEGPVTELRPPSPGRRGGDLDLSPSMALQASHARRRDDRRAKRQRNDRSGSTNQRGLMVGLTVSAGMRAPGQDGKKTKWRKGERRRTAPSRAIPPLSGLRPSAAESRSVQSIQRGFRPPLLPRTIVRRTQELVWPGRRDTARHG